jgi:hypothetical protein
VRPVVGTTGEIPIWYDSYQKVPGRWLLIQLIMFLEAILIVAVGN